MLSVPLDTDRCVAGGRSPEEEQLRSEQPDRRSDCAAPSEIDFHRPVRRMEHTVREAITMAVPLAVERPALSSLVDDSLELPRAFALAMSGAHATSESALGQPECGDLGS